MKKGKIKGANKDEPRFVLKGPRLCTILYLHDTIIHRFFPPKKLRRHCFRFPLGHLYVPGEIANNFFFGGGG